MDNQFSVASVVHLVQLVKDLSLKHSSTTFNNLLTGGVSNHWNGIWNGTVEWKIEWNGECT